MSIQIKKKMFLGSFWVWAFLPNSHVNIKEFGYYYIVGVIFKVYNNNN